MSKKERENKINELEERIFRINMVDRWSYEDRKMYSELVRELNELKKIA